MPLRPIPPKIAATLRGSSAMVDVHVHTFNHKDVPNGYLGIRVPMSRKFVSGCANLLKRLGSWFRNKEITGTSYFLRMFKMKDEDLCRKLLTYYPPNTVVCPLMMDMRGSVKGKMRTGMQDQLLTMRRLCDQWDGHILPFLGINPLADDVFSRFESWVLPGEKHLDVSPFWGIKLYPCMGYLPSDPDLMAIFAKCEQYGIPIMVHCSAATVKTTKHRIKNIEYYDIDGKLQRIRRRWFWGKDYDWFNDPKHWLPVFARYPKLTVCFAHFGGIDQWKRYMAGKDNTWVHRIVWLMGMYPNVYADFSYTLHNRKAVLALKELMDENSRVCERVLYGSDYYMLVREGHMRSIMVAFRTIMGDFNAKSVVFINPRRFLFGTT